MEAISNMFGDPKLYPVINSIVRIINEKYNDNIRKYCIKTIQEFHVVTSHVNHIDKQMRRYFMNLIKNDFYNRLDDSMIDELLKTHMRNLITGIYRFNLGKIKKT